MKNQYLFLQVSFLSVSFNFPCVYTDVCLEQLELFWLAGLNQHSEMLTGSG